MGRYLSDRNHGFTLVEAAIALGVVSLGGLAASAVIQNFASQTFAITQKSGASIILDQINLALRDPDRCASNLQGFEGQVYKKMNFEIESVNPDPKVLVQLDEKQLRRIVTNGSLSAEALTLLDTRNSVGGMKVKFFVQYVSSPKNVSQAYLGNGQTGAATLQDVFLVINFEKDNQVKFTRSLPLSLYVQTLQGQQIDLGNGMLQTKVNAVVVACNSSESRIVELRRQACLDLGGTYDELKSPACLLTKLGVASTTTALASNQNLIQTPSGLSVEGKIVGRDGMLNDSDASKYVYFPSIASEYYAGDGTESTESLSFNHAYHALRRSGGTKAEPQAFIRGTIGGYIGEVKSKPSENFVNAGGMYIATNGKWTFDPTQTPGQRDSRPTNIRFIATPARSMSPFAWNGVNGSADAHGTGAPINSVAIFGGDLLTFNRPSLWNLNDRLDSDHSNPAQASEYFQNDGLVSTFRGISLTRGYVSGGRVPATFRLGMSRRGSNQNDPSLFFSGNGDEVFRYQNHVPSNNTIQTSFAIKNGVIAAPNEIQITNPDSPGFAVPGSGTFSARLTQVNGLGSLQLNAAQEDGTSAGLYLNGNGQISAKHLVPMGENPDQDRSGKILQGNADGSFKWGALPITVREFENHARVYLYSACGSVDGATDGRAVTDPKEIDGVWDLCSLRDSRHDQGGKGGGRCIVRSLSNRKWQVEAQSWFEGCTTCGATCIRFGN
jgi:hypothetical protein